MKSTLMVLSILATCSRAFFPHTSSSRVAAAYLKRLSLVCNMSSSLPSVSEFVKSTRLDEDSKHHLTLGNPAGDADSIISAIALAYIDDTMNEKQRGTTVPIVSIPYEDLKTQRPETNYLLNLANVDVEDLITIDNLELLPSAAVTLVDHNVFSLKLDWKVTNILDHHMDEGKHLDTVIERNIGFDPDTNTALVASTCTLLVERYQSFEYPVFPPSLAILLLGVILIDSINMLPKAGKVTERDRIAVQALLDQTDWKSLALPPEIMDGDIPDTTRLFDTLQGQKFHPDFWNGLSVQQALKLDYKSFGAEGNKKFGVSSVLQTMSDFRKRPRILEAAESLLNGLEFLAIMHFSVVEDAPQRQISLVSSNKDLLHNLVEYMKTEGSLQVTQRDHETSGDTGLHMICLEQGNSKASRKQVAPLWMEYFKQQ